MYSNSEIQIIFLHCRNISEVLISSRLLAKLMESTGDFGQRSFIRAEANKRLKQLILT